MLVCTVPFRLAPDIQLTRSSSPYLHLPSLYYFLFWQNNCYNDTSHRPHKQNRRPMHMWATPSQISQYTAQGRTPQENSWLQLNQLPRLLCWKWIWLFFLWIFSSGIALPRWNGSDRKVRKVKRQDHASSTARYSGWIKIIQKRFKIQLDWLMRLFGHR